MRIAIVAGIIALTAAGSALAQTGGYGGSFKKYGPQPIPDYTKQYAPKPPPDYAKQYAPKPPPDYASKSYQDAETRRQAPSYATGSDQRRDQRGTPGYREPWEPYVPAKRNPSAGIVTKPQPRSDGRCYFSTCQ